MDAIKQALSANGWTEQDIKSAFSALENSPVPQAASPIETSASTQGFSQSAGPSSRKVIWASAVVALVVLGGGSVFAAYRLGFLTPPVSQTIVGAPATTTTSTSTVGTEAASATPISEPTVASTTSPTSLNQLTTVNSVDCPSVTAGNILVRGKVAFPKGIHQRDYTTLAGEGIGADGSFCAQAPKGSIFNLLFLSKSDDKALVIGATVYSQENISDVTVDYRSVATIYVIQSLILPVGSVNMEKIPNVIQVISNIPEVAAFADGISTAKNLSATDMDTGGSLQILYTNALTATLTFLSEKYQVSVRTL